MTQAQQSETGILSLEDEIKKTVESGLEISFRTFFNRIQCCVSDFSREPSKRLERAQSYEQSLNELVADTRERLLR